MSNPVGLSLAFLEQLKENASTYSIETNLGGEGTLGDLHGLRDINLSISLPVSISLAQFRNLIGVLEVFNGERFYEKPAVNVQITTGFTIGSPINSGVTITSPSYAIAPPAAQFALLQQSYEALKESVTRPWSRRPGSRPTWTAS